MQCSLHLLVQADAYPMFTLMPQDFHLMYELNALITYIHIYIYIY